MPETLPIKATLSASQQAAVDETLDGLRKRGVAEKLFARDPTAWSSDSGVQAKIANRLGWLPVIERMAGEAGDLKAFAAAVRDEGITDIVLLGMGGSSLAPLILRDSFVAVPGFPRLHIIDTTDPEFIAGVEGEIDLERTLFIVASKSGGTIEPSSLSDYFWELTGGEGSRFIAITDPDTALARMAAERRFRRAFINPPDIGGRYSALSYFGLVPGALIGLDPAALLGPAQRLLEDKSAGNPAVWLGAALAALTIQGRDKATFVLAPDIDNFGLWAEQLIAESTGKEGKGIVPIAGEEIGDPEVYSNDRVFVAIGVSSDANNESLDRLGAAGHPVLRLDFAHVDDLGAEFLRWEIATAIAGAAFDINPFDEPNVQESKDNTARLLDELQESGQLPEPGDPVATDGIAVYGDTNSTAEQAVRDALDRRSEGSYIALMAYLAETDERQEQLDDLRMAIRDGLQVATTLGYGPRFLHSTGQLHKGGRQDGVFVQLVSQTAEDIAIPGRPYSFGQLKAAQALGDFQALQSRGRPVIRVDLGADVETGLDTTLALFKDALT